jgi:hypothetical protein
LEDPTLRQQLAVLARGGRRPRLTPELFRAVGDETATRIVRRNRDRHLIAEHHPDAISAHAPGQMRQHRMSALDIDAEIPADENFHDFAFHFDQIVSCHTFSLFPYEGLRVRASPLIVKVEFDYFAAPSSQLHREARAETRPRQEATESLRGARPPGIVLFDCICRGSILDREFQREIESVKSVFPIAGFLTQRKEASTAPAG